MSIRGSLLVGLCVAGLALAFATTSQAQPGKPPAPQSEPFTDKECKIDSFVPGNPPMVKIISSKGEPLLMKAAKNAEIRVTGKAEFGFVKPGMLVQINAMGNKKTGDIEGEVKKFKIVTASNEFTPGMNPDTAASGDASAPASGDVKPYIIIGKVMAANARNGNKMDLQVPGVKSRVKVEVVAEPVIELDVVDLTLIKPGEKIDIIQAQIAAAPAGGAPGGAAGGAAGAFGPRGGRPGGPQGGPAAGGGFGGGAPFGGQAGGAGGAAGATGGEKIVTVSKAKVVLSETLAGGPSAKKGGEAKGRKPAAHGKKGHDKDAEK